MPQRLAQALNKKPEKFSDSAYILLALAPYFFQVGEIEGKGSQTMIQIQRREQFTKAA
jgi:hypothetical protein